MRGAHHARRAADVQHFGRDFCQQIGRKAAVAEASVVGAVAHALARAVEVVAVDLALLGVREAEQTVEVGIVLGYLQQRRTARAAAEHCDIGDVGKYGKAVAERKYRVETRARLLCGERRRASADRRYDKAYRVRSIIVDADRAAQVLARHFDMRELTRGYLGQRLRRFALDAKDVAVLRYRAYCKLGFYCFGSCHMVFPEGLLLLFFERGRKVVAHRFRRGARRGCVRHALVLVGLVRRDYAA